MYLGSHCGGQTGFGQHGLGSQQRGLGGQGSQQGSRSQQQLVKAERAKAAIKPKPSIFFIRLLLFCFRTIVRNYCIPKNKPFERLFFMR
jgi:hypothetical protein